MKRRVIFKNDPVGWLLYFFSPGGCHHWEVFWQNKIEHYKIKKLKPSERYLMISSGIVDIKNGKYVVRPENITSDALKNELIAEAVKKI